MRQSLCRPKDRGKCVFVWGIKFRLQLRTSEICSKVTKNINIDKAETRRHSLLSLLKNFQIPFPPNIFLKCCLIICLYATYVFNAH